MRVGSIYTERETEKYEFINLCREHGIKGNQMTVSGEGKGYNVHITCTDEQFEAIKANWKYH